MTKVLFETTDWNAVPVKVKYGKTGMARYRTIDYKGFRVRHVEYSAQYLADHWCSAGHIVYCIEGEMDSQLDDGRKFTLSKGMMYVVSDDQSRHRTFSEKGVTLIIVDGAFLGKEKHSIFNPWKM